MEEQFEVRDLRNGDWAWFNKVVLEHLNLTNSDKLVYLALTCFVNQGQKCFPSIKKITELTNLHSDTIIKAIKHLEELKFIEVKRIPGKVSNYVLLKLVQSYWFSKIKPIGKTIPPRKEEIHHPEKKNTNNNKEQYFTKVSKPRRDLQIISLYLKEIGIKPDNKDQFNQIIKRNLRAAKNLIGYSNEDIKATILVLKNTDYLKKFTLETVGKYIDQVIAEKSKQGPKIIRFEEIKKDGKILIRPIYEKKVG